MHTGHRPYQGYPYVSPIVTDVPSISAEATNRYANLPRRQLRPTPREPRIQNGAGSSGLRSPQSPTSVEPTLPAKSDPDESPVVYIDLPESNGSDVAQSIEIQDTAESSFVQDTIMFDPFENRRIELGKRTPEDTRSSASSISEVSTTGSQSNSRASNTGPFTIYRYPEPQIHQPRPTPPNTLDLNRYTGSSSSTNTSLSTPRWQAFPSFLMNETHVYRGDAFESLPSPVPGTNFMEPPPAYALSEIGLSRPLNENPLSNQIRSDPPRTEVITISSQDSVTPVGLPNHQRKFLLCQHCGVRVHTIVIKQNGPITHLIAFLVFIFLLPLVLIVYCIDTFKYKNHYCPNCNKLIGYISPIGRKTLSYVE